MPKSPLVITLGQSSMKLELVSTFYAPLITSSFIVADWSHQTSNTNYKTKEQQYLLMSRRVWATTTSHFLRVQSAKSHQMRGLYLLKTIMDLLIRNSHQVFQAAKVVIKLRLLLHSLKKNSLLCQVHLTRSCLPLVYTMIDLMESVKNYHLSSLR